MKKKLKGWEDKRIRETGQSRRYEENQREPAATSLQDPFFEKTKTTF